MTYQFSIQFKNVVLQNIDFNMEGTAVNYTATESEDKVARIVTFPHACLIFM
jgi:hypothetical protein